MWHFWKVPWSLILRGSCPDSQSRDRWISVQWRLRSLQIRLTGRNLPKVGQRERRQISIHGVSTVRWAERLAGARHTNDKLLPSRNSQSVSTFTCQLAFPTVEMARRAREKTRRFAIVFLDSGSEIFPAVSDFAKDLAPEPRSQVLCVQTLRSSQRCLGRIITLPRLVKSPGHEAAREGKPTGGPASCSLLGGCGQEDLPLSWLKGLALVSNPLRSQALKNRKCSWRSPNYFKVLEWGSHLSYILSFLAYGRWRPPLQSVNSLNIRSQFHASAFH